MGHPQHHVSECQPFWQNVCIVLTDRTVLRQPVLSSCGEEDARQAEEAQMDLLYLTVSNEEEGEGVLVPNSVSGRLEDMADKEKERAHTLGIAGQRRGRQVRSTGEIGCPGG